MNDFAEPRFNGYVGMPAALHLDAYARHLRAAFDTNVYLVGSATARKDWHDLDIVVMLDDKAWADTGFGAPNKRFWNGKWISLCLAYSVLGEKMIGKPVDFQIQPEAYAKANCRGPHPYVEIGLPLDKS